MYPSFFSKASLIFLGSFFFISIHAQNLKIGFGKAGLETVVYNEQYLLDVKLDIGQGLNCELVQLKNKKGAVIDTWAKLASTSVDIAKKEATYIYDWGKLTMQYDVINDTLFITSTLLNTGTDTLLGVNVYPVHFAFPEKPQPFHPAYRYNLDAPSIVSVSYGKNKLVVCNEEVKLGLFTGMLEENRPGFFQYKCLMSAIPYNGILQKLPSFNHKIAPGKSKTYRISVRFSKATTPDAAIAKNIIEKYRTAWPMLQNWKDRRPIGYLVLSSVENKQHADNPRGWLPNQAVSLKDSKTISDFQKKILEYAESSITILKGMHAQGVIVWDIEGQEFPHPLSYIGSPDKLQQLAPEMDAVANQYFKKFTDAGLKTGICIRPDSVIYQRETKKLDRQITKNVVASLAYKIRYAYKRWGCTLFYIDSNVENGFPMDPEVFKQLRILFPDMLLIPEHEALRYYAYCTPFIQLRSDGFTYDAIQMATYPSSFSCISVAESLINSKGLPKYNETEFKNMFSNNIILFRAWYNDPENNIIKERINQFNAH